MNDSQTVNIASYLTTMAERQPYSMAIIYPDGRDAQGKVRYTHYTFRQLDQLSNDIARGLERIGIGREMRTVLMVKPSLEFFALTFAIFKTGAVPVLVDPGIGIKSLGVCLAEAKPEAFIGIPAAHAARIVLGWARSTIVQTVSVGRRWFWGGPILAEVKSVGHPGGKYKMAQTAADEVAAILFTSGSTGVPKGAVYRHGNFVAQVEAIRKEYDIRPGEIDLPTFPLFALFDPALGMTTVVPDMDPTQPAKVDPQRIIEAVDDFGVTNMFGSPALLDTVGRWGSAHGVRLPSLRRVISAGAPVPARVMSRFLEMLEPEAEVFTPYGATEALPVASIASSEVLGDTAARTDRGRGVCVGRPVGEVQVAVIAISDEVIATWDPELTLPVGEIGEIVVRGPVVTRSYFNRDQATALAKITEEQDRFWHRLGDLGYFDKQGRLWFCGRKVHRVVTPAATLFTVPSEAVFNTLPEVFRTALVGIERAGQVIPVLIVELEKSAAGTDRARLTRQLLDHGATFTHTKGIEKVLFHPGFPVDIRHNAKINRQELAGWATRRLP